MAKRVGRNDSVVLSRQGADAHSPRHRRRPRLLAPPLAWYIDVDDILVRRVLEQAIREVWDLGSVHGVREGRLPTSRLVAEDNCHFRVYRENEMNHVIRGHPYKLRPRFFFLHPQEGCCIALEVD